MKTKNILYALLAMVMIISSCKKEVVIEQTDGILPSSFMVEIPSSISYSPASAKLSSVNVVPLHGDTIYEMLRAFVNVGDQAAQITHNIIQAINTNNLSQPMSFSFTGDDGNTKDVAIVNGTNYDYEMTISDAGNNALQVFWNTNSGNGVEGFSILNIYEIDHNNGIQFTNTLIRIDYSEVTTAYDKEMLVQITGWPMSGTNDIDNLKMFVGKTSSGILDIYGNSNHPTAIIVDTTHQDGFEWAFRAHSDAGLNIAVAEVGLPTTTHSINTDIFSNFSIYNVLQTEVHSYWDPFVATGQITQAQVDSIIDLYLVNAEAPGFFAAGQGFVKAGTAPIIGASGYNFLESRMNSMNLLPYIPSDINALTINWQ
ncbi:MAG: hypothetical protein H8E84_04685 [Flavobacteriales bacterium]|nr:hypothetical protein [Flavobacteriales bacterium]